MKKTLSPYTGESVHALQLPLTREVQGMYALATHIYEQPKKELHWLLIEAAARAHMPHPCSLAPSVRGVCAASHFCEQLKGVSKHEVRAHFRSLFQASEGGGRVLHTLKHHRETVGRPSEGQSPAWELLLMRQLLSHWERGRESVVLLPSPRVGTFLTAWDRNFSAPDHFIGRLPVNPKSDLSAPLH